MPGTRKLGKTTDQRMAMLRQQVTDFLDKGRMETTITRAKEIKPMAEKMITLGKKGDLAAYRQALSFITREDVANKLFKELAPSYAERNGGYTRIIRTDSRRPCSGSKPWQFLPFVVLRGYYTVCRMRLSINFRLRRKIFGDPPQPQVCIREKKHPFPQRPPWERVFL